MTKPIEEKGKKNLNTTEVSSRHNKISSSLFLVKKGVLLILSENFFGKTFILERAVTIIGRGEEAHCMIDDLLISKKHCQITIDEEGKFEIEDLGSKNLTYLNGRAIKKSSKLSYGDRIVIGNTIFRFFFEEKLGNK